MSRLSNYLNLIRFTIVVCELYRLNSIADYWKLGYLVGASFIVRNTTRVEPVQSLQYILYANYGRFGNQFFSISSFVTCGLNMGFKECIIDADSFTHRLNSCATLRKGRSEEFGAQICCIDAAFFHHAVSEFVSSELKRAERLVASQIVVPAITTQAKRCEALSTVTIHIRGGDIFDESLPQSYRHQPPLCWYKEVLKLHRHIHGLNKIVIVHEDDKNPCLTGLIRFAQESGLVIVQSSRSLEEDYRILMQSSVLIPSYGTFTEPCIYGSTCIKIVYRYADNHIKDGFIKRGEWRADKNQVDLMVSLPSSKVTLPQNFCQASQVVSSRNGEEVLDIDRYLATVDLGDTKSYAIRYGVIKAVRSERLKTSRDSVAPMYTVNFSMAILAVTASTIYRSMDRGLSLLLDSIRLIYRRVIGQLKK